MRAEQAEGRGAATGGATSDQILGEIRDFCRATQTAESTFGRLVVNDGKLVSRLRDGARITTGASIMPVTTTTASGFCTCEPMPCESAAGNSPTPATTQVINTGRSCNSPVRTTALMRSKPSSMS